MTLIHRETSWGFGETFRGSARDRLEVSAPGSPVVSMCGLHARQVIERIPHGRGRQVTAEAGPGPGGLPPRPANPAYRVAIVGPDNLPQMKKYSTANAGPMNGTLRLICILTGFIIFRLGSE